jgi:DNA polymerase-3 subunit alpha
MSDFLQPDPVEDESTLPPENGTLYLRLTNEEGKLFTKVKAILNMFPGNNQVVVYFSETGIRRGSKCSLQKNMLKELISLLGDENVVIK